MAWTTPRTWVANEVVTASLLNTHVRDNLNETGPAKVTTAGDTLIASAANALARAPGTQYAYAENDQSTIDTTTFANWTGMAFSVVASGIYVARFVFGTVTASGTGQGAKIQLTGPSSPTHAYQALWSLYVAGNGTAWGASQVATAFSTSLTHAAASGQMAAALSFLDLILVNGANAGTVQMQIANLAGGTQTNTWKKGSYVQFARLA